MNANLFYAAAALGATVLFLLMRPETSRAGIFRAALVMSGLAAVAMLIMAVAKHAPAPRGATDDAPFWLYVLCAFIAVIGAVRMVTHPRPVYAALYFILVIVSSATTFLLLQAEFMAFALLIVYGGAILITYLFVLMLAQQSGDTVEHGGTPAPYDRFPREPMWAAITGFVVLATLGDALFSNGHALPWQTPSAVTARAEASDWAELESMPRLLLQKTQEAARAQGLGQVTGLEPIGDGHLLHLVGNSAVVYAHMADSSVQRVHLSADAHPSNSQGLGWALVARFPVSLELAGVVLLMAMFGAVVLARRQIDLADDERRTAAGLPRLGEDPAHGGDA